MTPVQLLERMARQMTEELAANTFKGDQWLDADPGALEHELLYHVVKLLLSGRAQNTEGVTEYAADVANCAAILADKLGGLRKPQPGNATLYIELPKDDLRAAADRMLAALDDPAPLP